jgi:uncharacterized protein
MIRALASLLLAAMAGAALGAEPPRKVSATYRREIDAWKERRLERLKADDGWLSLAGLYWLEEGENRFGSSREGRIVLPARAAPAVAGSLDLEGGRVRLEVRPGAKLLADGRAAGAMELKSDADGKPTVLSIGDVRFYVIARAGRLAVRVKDPESSARTHFRGLDYFALDPSYRVTARFERFPAGRTISVPTVLGVPDQMAAPGRLVFELLGKTYRLDPVIEQGETDFFIIFGDRSNGHDTYGGGRFLYASPPGPDGLVIVDFNKAYNPPCVFSPYATCPMPPPQNRIPIRIEAGEKAYAGAHE